MQCMFACLFGLTLDSGISAQNEPACIPVVKTWEDLRALPAIDLGDGVKIRLGLEADKVPQWSGALLYCLVEGYTPATSGRGHTLGPALVDFSFEKEKLADNTIWEKNIHKNAKGTYLYVRTLPIDRIGTYHITVTDRQGKICSQNFRRRNKGLLPSLDALA